MGIVYTAGYRKCSLKALLSSNAIPDNCRICSYGTKLVECPEEIQFLIQKSKGIYRLSSNDLFKFYGQSVDCLPSLSRQPDGLLQKFSSFQKSWKSLFFSFLLDQFWVMVYFVDGKIDLVCPVNDTLENVP